MDSDEHTHQNQDTAKVPEQITDYQLALTTLRTLMDDRQEARIRLEAAQTLVHSHEREQIHQKQYRNASAKQHRG